MQQRLYEITLLLTQSGRASAAELSERFGVSKRTIYRDIDALSSAGIPVYTERGRGGGIRLLPGYVLDKALFSAEERRQLVSQLQGLASLGTPDSEAAFEKLAGFFGRADTWLEVDFAPWDGGEEMRRRFRSLRQAILSRNIVTFRYLNARGKEDQRRVEPLRVLFRGQGWYLYGYSQERSDFRYFKLTRIQELHIEANTFEREIPETPVSETPPAGALLPVRLRFDPSLSFRVYDEFSPSAIKPDPDGALLVEASFPSGTWLLGYLLSFGSGLTVLGPPTLQASLQTEIEKMLKNYKNNSK
ncbi:YafY family transcriptional regulator [Ruminococcaceae bacterium OttesenSCG-928-I18]|nr:YafY family transcriptional regulator [Ruminococcaceae bacterium OttesenSCG-928-I18]